MKTACPNEEVFAAYLEDLLPESQRSHMEAHLFECDACFSAFSLTTDMIRGEASAALEAAPPKVTQSALELINSRDATTSGGLLLKRIRRSISALHAGLLRRLPLPMGSEWEPAPIRGRREAVHADLFRVQKGYREFDADIEIEKIGVNTALIHLRLVARNGFSERIRVTLKRGDREICSSLYWGGDLIFEDISFGPCKLVFERDGVEIGVYLFHIKETGNGKK
ncbi:MAG: hypothetical protein K9N21_17470 [Deltaproteobacteria bacterium]|nr:hypothetical protein [Deltaproteobacteria bacterium]